MFTNIMFYVAWMVLSLLPSLITAFSRRTLQKKIIICFIILVITFVITTLLYK